MRALKSKPISMELNKKETITLGSNFFGSIHTLIDREPDAEEDGGKAIHFLEGGRARGRRETGIFLNQSPISSSLFNSYSIFFFADADIHR